jgi:hypothetical protein
MKKLIYIIISILFFSSCKVSNVYYTTDDVYFSSPAPRKQPTNYIDLNDRYLTMKSRSNRWGSFDDDFFYWNFPGSYSNRFFMPYTFNNMFWYNDLFLFNRFNFMDPFWSPFYMSPFGYGLGNVYDWRFNNIRPFYQTWNPYRQNNWNPNNNKYTYNNQHTRPIIRSNNYYNFNNMNNNSNYNRHNSPRQFNLGTYDNRSNNSLNQINNTTPRTGSAPIRKFN